MLYLIPKFIYFYFAYIVYTSTNMDNVVICLSVGVAIAVVLVLSGWTNKSPSVDGLQGGHQKAAPTKSATATEKSEYGTGLHNTEAAARYKELADLVSYDDYNSVAAFMSVEPSVYESHARYSDDMGRSTSGASMLPVRDDPNDVVPWMGLRKPKYQDAYVQSGARQEHSEIPDQMRTATSYVIG
jgi:hypothetical protein